MCLTAVACRSSSCIALRSSQVGEVENWGPRCAEFFGHVHSTLDKHFRLAFIPNLYFQSFCGAYFVLVSCGHCYWAGAHCNIYIYIYPQLTVPLWWILNCSKIVLSRIHTWIVIWDIRIPSLGSITYPLFAGAGAAELPTSSYFLQR